MTVPLARRGANKMNLKLITKTIALYLAVVMAFSGLYTVVLAEEETEDIRIINNAGAVWGAFGQYVEYEIDGLYL